MAAESGRRAGAGERRDIGGRWQAGGFMRRRWRDRLQSRRGETGDGPGHYLRAAARGGSGAEVLMALALGAKAVFIGRPYIYGLAVGGAKGVERVILILRDEFERAMALTGRRSIAEIDASVLRRRAAGV